MCQERVGANLVFAHRTQERKRYSFEGEHKVRPYIGLAHK